MFRRTLTLLFLTLILSLTGCSADNAEIATLRDELHVLRIGNFQLRSIIADFENHLESAGREIERVRVNTHVNDSRMTAQIKVLAHDRRKDGVAYKSALSRSEDRAEENKLLLDVTVRKLLSLLNPEQPVYLSEPKFQEAVGRVDPLSERLLVPMKTYVVGIDTNVTTVNSDGISENKKVGEYLPLIAAQHGWTLAELYGVNEARAHSTYYQWQKIIFHTPPFPTGRLDSYERDIYQPLGTKVRVPLQPLEDIGVPNELCSPTGYWAGVAYDGGGFDVEFMRDQYSWWDFEVQLKPDGVASQLYTYRAISRVENLHEGFSGVPPSSEGRTIANGDRARWDEIESGIVFYDSHLLRPDLIDHDGPRELIFDGCNILRAQGTRSLRPGHRDTGESTTADWYQVWYRLLDPENSDKR